MLCALTLYCGLPKMSDKHRKRRRLTEDRLSEQQWDKLAHLHDQLETFYDRTVSAEGRLSTLADHFQTLD